MSLTGTSDVRPVSRNRYIQKFHEYRISREFRKGGRFERLRRKNTFWKELTEAMAVREHIKRWVFRARYPIRFIADLGCGKGFLALLSALFHRDIRILAVDPDPSPDWSHFHEVPNIFPVRADILQQDFQQWLANQEGPGIIAGIHLCTDLAPRLIELYNSLPNVVAGVLVPCCAGDFDRLRFQWIIQELGVYEAWTTHLSTLPIGRVRTLRDPHILSDKNMLILMEKPEHFRKS